jgi:uncharacterized protein YqhQ
VANPVGPRPYIGGQAVIEGVFMRAPRALAVAVRAPNGTILVRKEPYSPFYQRFKFLKLPLIRGAFVMIDSLVVGIRALNWSAEQAADEPDKDAKGAKEPEATPVESAPEGPSLVSVTRGRQPSGSEKLALTGTLVLSFGLGIALFVALPHLLTAGIGWATGTTLDVKGFAFHVIDGIVKLAIFLGYLGLIRRHPEIRRVFAYHGAEHKTIYAYERELPLTLENVRAQTRFHPRCGTSFLLFVVGISILVFAAVFPFLPVPEIEHRLLKNLVQVAIKIPLTLPVAALSYEIIRLSSRFYRNPICRALTVPGLALQRLTTEEPDDRQLEVAITALQSAFDCEKELPGHELGLEGGVFPTGAPLPS